MIFKIFSRQNQHGRRWYFRGRAGGNHEIILRSEGYHNHADALATAELILAEAANATIDDSEYEQGARK